MDYSDIIPTSLFATIGLVGLILNVTIQLITKDFKKYLPRPGVVININNRSRYNMSYYFIKQLSIADTSTCVITIPCLIVAMYTYLKVNIVFCKALVFFVFATNGVTFFHIVLIAYYRYCLIVHPLKIVITFKQVRKYVIWCWVSGIVSALFFIYAGKPFTYKVGNSTQQDCGVAVENILTTLLGLFYLTVTFVIPISVTIYMSVKTIKVSWNQNALYNKKIKVTKMFVTVIVTFMLTYIINTVCVFVLGLSVVYKYPNVRLTIRIVALIFSVISPVVNPIVYAFQLKKFRKKLWRKLSYLVMCDNCASYPFVRDEMEDETQFQVDPVRLVRYEVHKHISENWKSSTMQFSNGPSKN